MQDKPQILVISPTLPEDAGQGMRMRVAAHIRALAALGRVQLAVMDPGGEADPAGTLAPLLEKVVRLPRPAAAQERLRRFREEAGRLSQIAGVFGLPPESAVQASAGESAQIATILSASTPDIVVFFRLSAVALAGSAVASLGWKAAVVVDFDDIESRALWRRLRTQWRSLGAIYALWLGLQCLRLRRLEQQVLASARAVLVCSAEDRDILAAGRPRAAVHVVPNTVALPPVPPPPRAEAGGPFKILFVGSMFYEPNEAGILWFLEAVWPEVRSALGPARCQLWIVGRNPRPAVTRFHDAESVFVTGEVPDVAEYYAGCDIAIAPIRYGGGTRIKIIEAMGNARAVVSTTVGAEGIPAIDGESIRLADTPADFAAAIGELARDPALRQRLAASGRALVEARFGRPASDRAWREAIEAAA